MSTNIYIFCRASFSPIFVFALAWLVTSRCPNNDDLSGLTKLDGIEVEFSCVNHPSYGRQAEFNIIKAHIKLKWCPTLVKGSLLYICRSTIKECSEVDDDVHYHHDHHWVMRGMWMGMQPKTTHMSSKCDMGMHKCFDMNLIDDQLN